MSENNTVVFDLDDTIIPTHHLYEDAKIEFYVEFLRPRFGNPCPDLDVFIHTYLDVDTSLYKQMGFSRSRLPTTFERIYETFAQMLKRDPSERDKQTARAYGERIFDEQRIKRNGLLDGAKETLDYVKAQGNTLVLLTQGDHEVQAMKVRLNSLDKWFLPENMHIVASKGCSNLTQIAAKSGVDNTWSVGNSKRADILPALQVGLGAVYVPCETWRVERCEDKLPEAPRLHVVSEILDVKRKYQEIFSRN